MSTTYRQYRYASNVISYTGVAIATQTYTSDTLPGSLLICVVGASAYNLTSPPYPVLTLSTPGIAWTKLGPIQSWQHAGSHFGAHSLAVYYATAPVLASSTVTTATASASDATGFPLDLAFEIFEFPGASGSVGSSATAFYNNGSPTPTTPDAGNLTLSAAGLLFVAKISNVSIGGAGADYVATTGAGGGSRCQIYNGGVAGQYDTPAGSYATAWAAGAAEYDWGCIAVAFGPGGPSGGGSTSSGSCVAVCTTPPLLNTIPGFSDLPDYVLMA